MKMFATITAATIALAGAAFAQTTTQAAVLGASDDPVYSLRVQGINGLVYNCKPDPEMREGKLARACVREDDGAGLFKAGSGLGAVGAGAGVFLVLLAAASGSSSPTTTN